MDTSKDFSEDKSQGVIFREELYHKFISSNPEFSQRVPQYMIASLLGMTPEFISKIRANKNSAIS